LVDLDSVGPVAASIEGWLSEAQGRALYAAAAAVRHRGSIVEIGSWKGRSTVWLAYGARAAGARVHAVDPHKDSREDPGAKTLTEFKANLIRAGIDQTVDALVMTSAEAAAVLPGPVELLFVDGDHSFQGARSDANIWLPRVITGGVVMFHDVATSGYSGPRRVFQQSICRSPEFHRIRKVGSMAIAERTECRTRRQALRARLFDLALFFYDGEAALKRSLRRLRGVRPDPFAATSC
jgi:predicted O-methyltransferase YrrM